MYKIPIGVDNFHELVTEGYLFCDKTAMIADFLKKGEKVTLITRPRRWGKTLNMSMLHHFLAPAVDGLPTAGLFDNLEIGRLEGGKYIAQYQGKHPVIMLSFKDVHADNFEGAYDGIYELMFSLFGAFEYLLHSNKINSAQSIAFKSILNKSAHKERLESSLKLLSHCLYQHHGQKVYIIIDEYDTPLNKAYGNEQYLNALVAFMRNLFSAGLKGNTSLERGVLTGILRVSKDSMLSGLNNLETYTLLDEEYSSYFGFSEEELKRLFHFSLTKEGAIPLDFDAVKRWYNGYKVGHLVMYNPWSILSCINRSGSFDVYWVNTGNNDLIKQSLLRSSSAIKSKFEQLMQRETLTVSIDKHLSFDLLDSSENSLWSLLLFAGYLKVVDAVFNTRNGLYDCALAIPNQEVSTLYNRFFEEWLSTKFPSHSRYDTFVRFLLSGKVNEFIQDFNHYLFESISFFDVHSGKQGESFYHGFVLAMLASISDRYYIRSNRESGYGRYDVLLIPKGALPLSQITFPMNTSKAILLEFKQVVKEKALEDVARSALEQIQTQVYRTELSAYPHVQEVVEVGIAFSGKEAMAAYASYDLVHKQAMPVQLTDRYQE